MFVLCLLGHIFRTRITNVQNFFRIFLWICKNKFYFCTVERDIELWCNGNTTDSGPVIPGSNPGSSTRKDGQRPSFFFVVGKSGFFYNYYASYGAFFVSGSKPLLLKGGVGEDCQGLSAKGFASRRDAWRWLWRRELATTRAVGSLRDAFPLPAGGIKSSLYKGRI